MGGASIKSISTIEEAESKREPPMRKMVYAHNNGGAGAGTFCPRFRLHKWSVK